MAIIAESGAIYALYDRRDSEHGPVRSAVESFRERLHLPSPILGEIDYLLRSRLGNDALLRFLADIQKGAFSIEQINPTDLRRCAVLIEKYANLGLGLSDASVVAVAERLGINRILTVDRRDFRIIRMATGKSFKILPSDGPE